MSKTKPKLAVVDVEPIGEGVIKSLDAIRKLAKKGEIASVAIMTVYRDGSTGRSWSKIHNFSIVIGGVMRMLDDMLKAARGDE